MIVKTIEDFLKPQEGLKFKPYKDTRGYWTIGYGHKMTQQEIATIKQITLEQSEALFKKDIEKATELTQNNFAFFSSLSDCRKAILISMVFNMGMEGVKGFHNFLRFASENKPWDAAREMVDSNWSKEVGDRTKKLARAWATNTWPEA